MGNEEFDDYLKEYYEWLDNEESKMKEAFDFYKKNSLIPFEEIQEMWDYDELFDFENGGYRHIGYCSVIESNYTNHWYKNAKFFDIKDTDCKESMVHLHFMKILHDKDFHTLVWQTTTCGEDDYSGYILFPMNDGRYWIVSFDNI